ncbi:MAG TPA: class I SAM-dependent methyltransferase [Planctomycetota bacterium]|nr:class I SAM-dependent methyltransferase [Planctomycetota bacterium]
MKHFYDELWTGKDGKAPGAGQHRRDWFHRWFLDHLINPFARDRTTIAREMLPSGDRLLDIGCWGGEEAKAFGAFEKFKEVHGVDLIEESIKRANERGLKAKLADMNVDPLPYDDRFFDCVTLMAILEHVTDPYKVLREVHRVLKPGGTLIVSVPNVASFSNRFRVLFGRCPVTSLDPGWDGGHLHYFTPRDLKRLLGEIGFKVVGRAATGGLRLVKQLLFSLVGEFVYQCERRA